jgi:hypothetical protein
LIATAPPVAAQRKPERPKIHAEFQPGSLPLSREFAALMAKEEARLVLVGLHQGWDLEKISKETKLGIDDISRVFADLEDARLAFAADEYTDRPAFPVIREAELDKLKTEEKIAAHTRELSKLLQSHWTSLETLAGSLAADRKISRDEVLYQIVVGGLLYGSMLDVFFEDQTLMVPPPRRVGSQRYYGWLIEGEPRLAGVLKREQWESEGHLIVSIGSTVEPVRSSVTQIRTANGMVLDEAESRRLRSFLSVFSRDTLLPFFKRHRSDIFAAVRQFDAGRYGMRVTDIFSWYYDQMVNRAVEDLIKAGKLTAPSGTLAYAVQIPSR